MNNNNTKFKDSTLGKIPCDWEILEFGDFVETEKGKYNPVENESLRCLELEHFEQGTGHILGWVNSSEQQSTKNKFKKGQVLFGKLRPYLQKYWLAEYDGVCSSEVWVLNSKNIKCSNEFLFRIVQSNRFIQVANVSSGSKMPRADWDYVSTFPFQLPPRTEQKAIAHILGLMDSAININNRLIAQKELQKKWLMQNLLTGKKRLKGFDGEWNEFHLGSLGDTYSGLTGKSKQDFGAGKPYIPYLNIFSNFKIDLTNFDYVEITERDKQNKAKYGDIFFTVSSETPDEVGMASVLLDHVDELYLNSFCFGFRLYNFKTMVPEFSSYFLRADAFREEIYKLSQGATRFNLSKNNLMKLNVILPNPEEQIAIAQVLQAADKEIQLLKTKTEKLREQKKGLMQVLLTGKKRLKVSTIK